MAARSQGGTPGKLYDLGRYEEAETTFGKEDALTALVKLLMANGAARVLAVPVEEEADYPAARQWTERYGRRITVKFGVTLYSPEAAGESGCQALLEQVAQALMERGPAGFAVEKWSAGETAFDQASGMFWGKLQAVCRGMLVAGMEESGELEGFTVRGEVTL